MRITRTDFMKIRARYRESGRFFTVSASPIAVGTKFACVIGKKMVPKAHDRNLIRRRARAAFLELDHKNAVAYVLTAKKSVNGATFADIQGDIASLVVKVNAGLKG